MQELYVSVKEVAATFCSIEGLSDLIYDVPTNVDAGNRYTEDRLLFENLLGGVVERILADYVVHTSNLRLTQTLCEVVMDISELTIQQPIYPLPHRVYRVLKVVDEDKKELQQVWNRSPQRNEYRIENNSIVTYGKANAKCPSKIVVHYISNGVFATPRYSKRFLIPELVQNGQPEITTYGDIILLDKWLLVYGLLFAYSNSQTQDANKMQSAYAAYQKRLSTLLGDNNNLKDVVYCLHQPYKAIAINKLKPMGKKIWP